MRFHNLGTYRRISLFVDEGQQRHQPALDRILNKGAEGGIFATCAMERWPTWRGAWAAGRRHMAGWATLNNHDRALRTGTGPGLRGRDLRQDRDPARYASASATARTLTSRFSSSYSTQLTESFEGGARRHPGQVAEPAVFRIGIGRTSSGPVPDHPSGCGRAADEYGMIGPSPVISLVLLLITGAVRACRCIRRALHGSNAQRSTWCVDFWGDGASLSDAGSRRAHDRSTAKPVLSQR